MWRDTITDASHPNQCPEVSGHLYDRYKSFEALRGSDPNIPTQPRTNFWEEASSVPSSLGFLYLLIQFFLPNELETNPCCSTLRIFLSETENPLKRFRGSIQTFPPNPQPRTNFWVEASSVPSSLGSLSPHPVLLTVRLKMGRHSS
ncbi:hypothetical protein CEXT_6901 [Caerostris extrusa]|uniref:Uncharacterized protein n=1 Tax=Caerostris extrusa TaxID=172846 RepID=A0AAV4UM65_CAEEX|nr:hypothetical protein CEXT_6901 [Caerostris extrusa]